VDKKQSRLRRARSIRLRIRGLRAVRLAVHRSNQHIYAQIIAADGSSVLASASTLDKDIRGATPSGANVGAAEQVGKRIAEKAKALGIEEVAFDRSGFKFHGRVKALAQAAREGGLKF
jgi:large subunit ribosomal protein L18